MSIPPQANTAATQDTDVPFAGNVSSDPTLPLLLPRKRKAARLTADDPAISAMSAALVVLAHMSPAARKARAKQLSLQLLWRMLRYNVMRRYEYRAIQALHSFPRVVDKQCRRYTTLMALRGESKILEPMRLRLINFLSEVERFDMYIGQPPTLNPTDVLVIMLDFGLREDVPDVVETLEDAGADMDEWNTRYMTALMLAVRSKRDNVVKALVSAKANLNKRDQNGMTALMSAVCHGTIASVETLVKGGANLNIQNACLRTATKMAAYEGYRCKLQHLINGKADLNISDRTGMTPLVCALHRGHTQVVRLLAEGKADVSSALLAWPRTDDVARILLAAKADMTALKDDQTALMVAMQHCSKELVDLLVQPIAAGIPERYNTVPKDRRWGRVTYKKLPLDELMREVPEISARYQDPNYNSLMDDPYNAGFYYSEDESEYDMFEGEVFESESESEDVGPVPRYR